MQAVAQVIVWLFRAVGWVLGLGLIALFGATAAGATAGLIAAFVVAIATESAEAAAIAAGITAGLGALWGMFQYVTDIYFWPLD